MLGVMLLTYVSAVASEERLATAGRGSTDLADALREVGRLRRALEDSVSDRASLLTRFGELREEVRTLRAQKLYRPWWVRWVWGVSDHPPEPEVVVIQGCETLGCCFSAAALVASETARNMAAALWRWVADPGDSITYVWGVIIDVTGGKRALFSRVAGPLIVAVAANFIAYAYLEIFTIVGWAWSLIGMFVRLPIIVLTWRGIKALGAAVKGTVRKSDAIKDDTCQPAVDLAALTSELTQLKEALRTLQEASVRGREPVRQAPAVRPVAPPAQGRFRPCWWCGSRLHHKDKCPVRYGGKFNTNVPEQLRIKTNVAEKKVNVLEINKTEMEINKTGNEIVETPEISETLPVCEFTIQKVQHNVEKWKEGTLFRTPLWLGHKQIAGCLLDTGSEANILPLDQCLKHGFTYQTLDRPIHLSGFMTGVSSSPVGSVEFTTSIGPSHALPVRFLVVEGAKETIVGLPTLVKAGLVLNCDNGEVECAQTGGKVRCGLLQRKNGEASPSVAREGCC